MKTIIIPESMNPFELIINGKKYSYPAGTQQDVPDEVAALIEANALLKPKPEDKPAGGNSGGDTRVHIGIADWAEDAGVHLLFCYDTTAKKWAFTSPNELYEKLAPLGFRPQITLTHMKYNETDVDGVVEFFDPTYFECATIKNIEVNGDEVCIEASGITSCVNGAAWCPALLDFSVEGIKGDGYSFKHAYIAYHSGEWVDE